MSSSNKILNEAMISHTIPKILKIDRKSFMNPSLESIGMSLRMTFSNQVNQIKSSIHLKQRLYKDYTSDYSFGSPKLARPQC